MQSGVAVCRFSGEVLIVAFKRRFRVVFWFIQYLINLHSPFEGSFVCVLLILLNHTKVYIIVKLIKINVESEEIILQLNAVE